MADDLTKPVDLYDRDYVAWAEAQAAALRARGAGGNALDYDNLAEEVEDLGKSEIHACASQIDNIIRHLLKIEYVGPLQTVPHWRGEVFEFRRQLRRRLTRTIENRLRPELADTNRAAIKSLRLQGFLAESDQPDLRTYSWEQIVDPDWYPQPRYTD